MCSTENNYKGRLAGGLSAAGKKEVNGSGSAIKRLEIGWNLSRKKKAARLRCLLVTELRAPLLIYTQKHQRAAFQLYIVLLGTNQRPLAWLRCRRRQVQI